MHESIFYKQMLELMDEQETIVTRYGPQTFLKYEKEVRQLEKILNLRNYLICA